MLNPQNATEAIIVGAGVGGLTTAIALQNIGIQTKVYEKAKALRPVGAGLTLYPNGLKSLEAIQPGLANQLVALGTPVRHIVMKSTAGDVLFSKPVDLAATYGYPMLNVKWSTLQQTLLSRLPVDTVRLNHRCAEVSQQVRKVMARFTNGTAVSADFLIGADGIHSSIRQHVMHGEPAQFSGRLSWRFVTDISHPMLRPNESTMMLDPANKQTLLLADMGNGRWFFSASMQVDQMAFSETPEATKARLHAAFGHWADPVPSFLAAAPAEKIIERPLGDCLPLSRWHMGRVALLGDAAHAMTPSLGQGANTAFADAHALAEALLKASSVPQAIAAYESARRWRTQIIQARSAFISGRSYDPDSQAFIQTIWENANVDATQFDDWLYDVAPKPLQTMRYTFSANDHRPSQMR
ncbi:MAG: FAD-dependent monooxygenase [Chloroflexota bacterium]